MQRLRDSITARLLGYVVLTSTILTLFLVGIQIYLDYSNERDRIEKSVVFIEESFGPILAEDLWNLDREALRHTMRGVLKVDYVDRVSLQENSGLSAGSVGHLSDPDYIEVRTIPIYYRLAGNKTLIGTLEVVYGLNLVYLQLINKFSVILISNFIKTIAIIFIIFMIFDKVLTRHLRKMTDFLSNKESLENKGKFSFERERGRSYYDELDKMQDSLNWFLHNVRTTKAQIKKDALQKEELQRKALGLAHYVGIAEVSNGIIHNLRNLMSIIYMSAQWIEDRTNAGVITSTDSKYQKKVKKITYAIDTAMQIIKSQQDSSSGVAKQVKKIVLKDFLDSAIYLMDFMIANNTIKVTNEVSQDLVIVGKTADLVNVIINLLKNAVEAMQGEDPEHRHINFHAEKTQSGCVLSITDTGSGIEPSTLKKLFSFGYSSKSRGHGFGLHSCRAVLREMGGDMEITSKGLGRGSTVLVTLPLADSGLHDIAAPEAS